MRYIPDGNVARHLVGAANEGKPIATVEVPVPLVVPVLALHDHLYCVEASCRYEGGGLSVGVGKVRVDDVSALGVGLVGPMAEGRLHRAADLGLGRAVGAERHHGLL